MANSVMANRSPLEIEFKYCKKPKKALQWGKEKKLCFLDNLVIIICEILAW